MLNGFLLSRALLKDSLLVVYDAPDPSRRPDPKAMFADVFRLPNRPPAD